MHIIARYLERGPGKVAASLRMGFNKLDIEERSLNESRNVACLQWGDDWGEEDTLEGKNVLFGPNNWETPVDGDWPSVIQHFNHFITPSEWTRNVHMSYDVMFEKNMYVWPAGIDTERWSPLDIKPDIDCFIYFKNRERSELEKLIQIVSSLGLSCGVLGYGGYTEENLYEAAQRSRFCLVLDNTESQGIAYMEILSTGTPCLIFDKDTWTPRDQDKIFHSTSAPYFNELCGMKAKDISKENVETFMHNLNTYDSRSYIMNNHTIEKSTSRYLEIFNEVFGEK